MRTLIPSPVIAVVAEILERRETHATMNSLFWYADAPGDAPEGNKRAKATEWLRRVNKHPNADPMRVLGKLLENCMEVVTDPLDMNHEQYEADKIRLQAVLGQHSLQYVRGGLIVGALAAPSRTLDSMLRECDFAAVDHEFERALSNVESEPREAVSAASNIIESFCKVYIVDNGLEMPTKQDLKPIWSTVRKHLGFDPSVVVDQDLQTILTGLLSVVEGIGALRTHASSAHGAGKTSYRLEPRHARLAIHAAHTLVLFALETWDKRRNAALAH
ncbi:abortive infection family protein [Cupriavidus necator]|uniref:abortive infection family protein n=1 Tax=Cupriavidus necator TaxID=106590 RepID=UPI003ED07097